jgi:hypothetical protein
MFSHKTKLNDRSVWVLLAVVLVALVAGVYFAFNPFPTGPSIDVAANAAEVPVVIEGAPAVTVFESGAPLHYSGKVIESSAASAAPAGLKHYIAGNLFESGAPLHYSGKVITPVFSSSPPSSIHPQYRRWFRFETKP